MALCQLTRCYANRSGPVARPRHAARRPRRGCVWPLREACCTASERASCAGVCRPLLAAAAWLPVLGVCLGHQALGAAHGARVVRAPEAVHGRLSAVTHNGHPLFAAIPSGALYTVRLFSRPHLCPRLTVRPLCRL